MIPYLLCFSLSIGLACLATQLERNGSSRILSNAFFVLAILVPCMLAGARDVSVGTDTSGYGVWIYKCSLYANSLSDYLNNVERSQWDVSIGFSLFAYSVSNLFHSQFIYFLAIECLILAPIAYVIKKHSGNHAAYVLLIYYLAFYIPGLNVMRQSIAVSLVVLALHFLYEGRKRQYFLFNVLALFFHTSALIGILFFLIWIAFVRKKDSEWVVCRYAQSVLALFLMAAFFATFFFQDICDILAQIPKLKHLALYAAHEGSELGVSSYIFAAGLIAGLFALVASVSKQQAARVWVLFGMVLLALPFIWLAQIDITIERMSEYSLSVSILLVAVLVGNHRNRCSYTQFLGLLTVFVACCFRFIWAFGIKGFNDAIPYTAVLFGIT